MPNPSFQHAAPYQTDILALPVTDLDTAATWYTTHFGMTEVERRTDPPTVILERDGIQIGFAITGTDPTQDGAAIRVTNIHALKEEFEHAGVEIGNWRTEERDGKLYQVFFVVAPDKLCYYFPNPSKKPSFPRSTVGT